MTDDDLTQHITALTCSSAWEGLAELVNGMEADAVNLLRSKCCPIVNQKLIFLAVVKAEIQKWSKKKEIWNV